MDREKTKGERRVGVNFNPSKSEVVDALKRAGADFIDLVEDIAAADGANVGEVTRLKSIAMTDIETATMYAVKAATKGAD